MSEVTGGFKNIWFVAPIILPLAIFALLVVSQMREDSGTTSKSETAGMLDYQWSPEEQAKREAAIVQKDSSLLPTCTDDYIAWRTATEEDRMAADGLMPPSPDFWSAPGCKARVDMILVTDISRRSDYD